MKTFDKSDIEVGAMALTNRWKWDSVLDIGRKVQVLRDKEIALNKKAAGLIKEIKADSKYKENYKKVRKHYKDKKLEFESR